MAMITCNLILIIDVFTLLQMSMIGNGNIIITTNGHLGCNQGTSQGKKKVKIEGVSSTVSTRVEPPYGAKPNIIFDRKQLVSKQQFTNTYNICIKGPSPKCLKLRDFEKEEVEKIFGPYINRNGYHYTWSSDEQLIAEVERLWMITH